MANEYLMAVLKNSIGESSLVSVREGDSPATPSFCPSSKNSSVGDFEEIESCTMGIRSPSGPMRGRSVKEFEEQLTNLKKENFNLKLRIYFLEEKMGTNFTLDKDNVVKQNVELKIEIANLQKEAKEKHELLCQAVKAMELEEDDHRKEAQSKDDHIAQLQQELDDLRTQLQDIRFLSNVESAKSGVSSRQLENIDNYENEFVPDDLKGRYSEDCESVNHHTQLANFAFDKTETLKLQVNALQKECQLKDQTINGLNADLTSANQRLIDFAQQIKEYEEKLAQAHVKMENLMATIQEKQHTVEKLCSQLTSLNQKYSVVKYELDQDRREFERDRKSLERNKIMSDMRGDALEHETKKNREVIKELQAKLEAAITEAKKNQNLAVSKISDSATPDGTPKKDSLHVPIKAGQSSKVQTPDGKHLTTFEKLLTEREDSRILNEFTMVKNEFNAQKQKIVKLKSEQLKACEIIKIMIDTRNKANEEISQLKKAKEELEKQLENVVSKPQQEYDNVPLVTKVSDLNIRAVGTPPANEKHDMDDALQQTVDMEIMEQYKRLALELEAKIEVLEATLKEKDSQMQYIRVQYEEILNILAEKENKIVDLEFELLSTNQNSGNVDRSLLEKGDTGSEKRSSFYKQELEEKNKEIEKLNVELKKCTCYLQEIVNKELWAKNREIEKMHLKQESTAEVVKLRKELSEKDMQLKLLKEKISELGLDPKFPTGEAGDPYSPKKNIEHIKVLQEQLKIAKEEKTYFEQRILELDNLQATIESIQAENNDIKNELARSERLRAEATEVCSVLSTRLEELAIFLDSLLKQKSVLGFLGSAKNKRLREIINNSLDMSRSFTMSLMANPEQSLAQLSNITTLLNGSVFQDLSLADDAGAEEETHLSIVPDNITLTYESHLHKKTNDDQPEKERVIATLRDQIVNLKSELKLRDNELNKLNGNKESGVEKLTETEEEKGVSKLFTPKSTSATIKAGQCEGQSESEAWSEPDRAVSRARIGLNNSVPAAFKPTKLHYNESTEDDDLYHAMTPSKRRSTIMELTQDICRLEKELEEKSEQVVVNNRMYRQKLQDLDRELQECREKLLQANMEKNSALTKVEDLQKVVNELSISKKQYEEGMLEKNKETQDKINQLEQEKQKVIEDCQTYERQAANAKNEAILAEEQLKTLQLNMNQLEESLRKQYEETLIEKLKHAEEVFTRRVKSVEEKCEAELRIAQENITLIKEEYSKDYIKKSDVQSKLDKVEHLIHELEDLKTTVQSYEETISSYKDKEKEIKRTVQEYENQIHTLKSELENTTLQYSEAVLEKTRLYNEKQVLEQQISHISHKEEELRAQLKDIQVKLSGVSQKYDQQLLSVQKQKSNLELKLSELESSNAELHNRLIKAQSVKFGVGLNATMPGSMGSSRTVYRRQCSDQNTVSSEDNVEELRGCGFNRSQVNSAIHPSAAEAERAVSNSSPDLGIESDHGRFSSLETNANNVPRPLLQTIELTESMNDLFEAQNTDAETNTSGTDHCCQKSLDIARENNELKRKLLRMKRALEETATQLNLANQRKKQVEKTICKQIHKTSQVLRKAKANLDSGSESDVFRM